MKTPSKIGFCLAFLVFGVLVMRNSDVSIGTPISHVSRALRLLFQSSAGVNLCADIDINSPFTDAELSAAASAKASVQSMRGGGNPLKDALEKGNADYLNDYALPLIPLVAAWIAMFLISIVVCLGLCCSWCCMHGCCKNTKCCKCCKQPKTFNKKWAYVGVTVVFLLGTFSAGIAGASFSGTVSKGMRTTLCSFIGLTEDFVYGVPDKQWLGLSKISASLGLILADLNGALGNTANDIAAVQTAKTAGQNEITTVYNNRQAATLPRAGFSASPSTYKPFFIQNLGPTSDQNTATGSIYTEFQVTADVLASTGSAIDAINNNLNSIQSGLSSGKGQIDDVTTKINDLLDTLGNTGATVKDAFGGIGSALTAIFVVYIVISVLVILAIAVILMKQIKFLNKFLHFSWCVFIILTILSWILAAVLYPTSVVMMEVCDVVETVLFDASVRQRIFSSVLEGQTGDIFSTCLAINDCNNPVQIAAADLTSQFSLGTYFDYFTNMEDQFKATNSRNMSIDNPQAPTSFALAAQLSLINGYLDNSQADSTETTQDLNNLNNIFTQSCSTNKDTWNLLGSSCSSFSGTTFTSASTATAGKPGATCIGFDVWNAKTYTGANRYSSGEFTCTAGSAPGGTNTYAYVTGTVDGFKTNRAQATTLFNNLKNDFNGIQTKYNDFATKILTVLNDFNAIQTRVSGIGNRLFGTKQTNGARAQDGVISNLKCAFVKCDIQRISNAMCTGFVAGLYSTSVAIIVTSFFTLFSTVAIFLLTKRILLPQGYLPGKTSPGGLSPPTYSPY